MQTIAQKEKAPSADNARSPMQTEPDCAPGHQRQQHKPLNPRQARALSALLQGPQSRERIDRTTGASNGPDVVARLRRRLGLTIPCELCPGVDRDGLKVETGIYRLTENDKAVAESFLLACANEQRQTQAHRASEDQS